MSLDNLNQSKLITLKDKAQATLEELQMNCDFDYENYHEALDQLTAIDGWTESQPTDVGYSEGRDWYAAQKECVKELKAYLNHSEAKVLFFKAIMTLVFETNFITKLETNILTEEVVSAIYDTNNVNGFSFTHFEYSLKEMLLKLINLKTSTWQAREILALLKHLRTQDLFYELKFIFGDFYSSVYEERVKTFICDLKYLEYLEEVVTLGMLDLVLE